MWVGNPWDYTLISWDWGVFLFPFPFPISHPQSPSKSLDNCNVIHTRMHENDLGKFTNSNDLWKNHYITISPHILLTSLVWLRSFRDPTRLLTLCQSAFSIAAPKSDSLRRHRHPHWGLSHRSCCHNWKPVRGDFPHWDRPWGQAWRAEQIDLPFCWRTQDSYCRYDSEEWVLTV